MMYRSCARFRDWGLILCARTVSNLILNAETFEPVAGSDSYLIYVNWRERAKKCTFTI
ncbi:hypothetical protein ABKV19_025734 [Rosa sericea]